VSAKAGEEAAKPAAADATAKPDAEKKEAASAKTADEAKDAKDAKDAKEAKPGEAEKAKPAEEQKAKAPVAAAAATAAPGGAASKVVSTPPEKPAAPKPAATTPASATTAAATAATSAPRSPAPPVPPRPQPVRASVPPPTFPPRHVTPAGGGAPRRPARNTLLAVGAVVLVAAVGIALVLRFVGGDDNGTPSKPNSVGQAQPAQTPASAAPATSRAERAQTNVAVLNGTTVTGLARSVANRVQEQGYTIGNVTDAANQAQPLTKVEFGAGHADEARAVARAIRISANQVVALDDNDKTTAGPDAEVVVVVGQDAAH
jgi:hypothetical protein